MFSLSQINDYQLFNHRHVTSHITTKSTNIGMFSIESKDGDWKSSSATFTSSQASCRGGGGGRRGASPHNPPKENSQRISDINLPSSCF